MGKIVERSDFADNYQAEGLGAIGGLLILRAATMRVLSYKECLAYCDNLGIVCHASKPNKPLSEKQSQWDVIGLIKQYVKQLDFDIPYHHVHAHLDKVLRWDQLTYIQKLNVECDSLGKEALLNGIVDQKFISSRFPFEDIVLTCGGKKAMGSHTTPIYKWWGYDTARAVFHSKRIVDQSDFDLTYWKGMNGVTRKRSPKMFRVFITKHVTGTCGINAHLSKIDPIKYKNVCPSCGMPPRKDQSCR